MMNTHSAQTVSTRLLVAVFSRSRRGEPVSAARLAAEVEVSQVDVRRALDRLVRRGFLQPVTYRLTLRGLAAAAALQPSTGRARDEIAAYRVAS